MTPKNFRVTMIYLGVLAIIILLSIFIYIIVRPQLSQQQQQSCPVKSMDSISQAINAHAGQAYERDIRVLEDPLYPPLNRTDEPNFNTMATEVKSGDIYVPTNMKNQDSYRLIGYLINHESIKDAGGNNWKFFGRMKDRYTGEYFISFHIFIEIELSLLFI